MATSSNQRTKLLYLMKIMLEKTDEQNPITINEIIKELSAYDIKAERKSIYTDLDLLRQFGLDIEKQRSKTTGYYIAERQFDLPELKVLVDAVQSSQFITKKKSEELIKKLASLTSNEQAKQLKRQVYITERAKALNEAVYYNIDYIHQAVNEKKKISFKYFDYSVNKKRIYRKNGNEYHVTPISLCWNDDKYYLIAYSKKYDNLTHYRVDRMSNVNISAEDGDGFDKSKWNISEHCKKVFGMFDEGETIKARLSFDNCLINTVMDKFGKDVRMIAVSEGWFDIIAEISVSPVFLAWMFQFGKLAVIKEPDDLIGIMQELLDENSHNYSSI